MKNHRRRLDRPAAPRPYTKHSAVEVPAEWVFFTYTMAMALDAVLARYAPSTRRRLLAWARAADDEYRHRTARDGPLAACQWLLEEAQHPHLPDLRARKAETADAVLLQRYEKLRAAVEPVFRHHKTDQGRRVHAARIVAEVMGGTRRAEDLPSSKSLTEFCQEVLGVTSVRLSRGRRRRSAEAARFALRGLEIIEAVIPRLDKGKQKTTLLRVAQGIRKNVIPHYKRRRLL